MYTTNMAYALLASGKTQTLTKEQGLLLWNLMLQDSVSPEEQQKLDKINRLYLNWQNAPDSYIQAHLSLIIPLALNSWMVSRKGYHTRPGSDAAWKFAKRWGLWEFGGPSALVTGGQVRVQY